MREETLQVSYVHGKQRPETNAKGLEVEGGFWIFSNQCPIDVFFKL